MMTEGGKATASVVLAGRRDRLPGRRHRRFRREERGRVDQGGVEQRRTSASHASGGSRAATAQEFIFRNIRLKGRCLRPMVSRWPMRRFSGSVSAVPAQPDGDAEGIQRETGGSCEDACDDLHGRRRAVSSSQRNSTPDLFLGRSGDRQGEGCGRLRQVFFSETVKESDGKDERLTFRLRSPATIEGRLLTPAGAPAAGVKVLLEDFRDSAQRAGGRLRFRADPSTRTTNPGRDYWPKSWTTDSDGRFRIEGIVPEKTLARLHFRHPDFADDDLFVSTGLPLTDWLRAFNVKPVDAQFHPYARAGAAGDRDCHRQGDRSAACRRARRDDAVAKDESLRRG